MFLALEELGPLLAYTLGDGEWQAVVAMWHILRDLYWDTPPRADLRPSEVARTYRLHCCKATCQSNYLFYLEGDVTLAVANVARPGVGSGAVHADVSESLNAILKGAYNDHRTRGGGNAGGFSIRPGGGGGLASLGVVVCRISPTTPWGTTYDTKHYGQTHGQPKPPALLFLVPSPCSCFATSWTNICWSPSRGTC